MLLILKSVQSSVRSLAYFDQGDFFCLQIEINGFFSTISGTSQLTSAELIEEIEYLAGYYKMLDKATINIRCRVCMTVTMKCNV